MFVDEQLRPKILHSVLKLNKYLWKKSSDQRYHGGCLNLTNVCRGIKPKILYMVLKLKACVCYFLTNFYFSPNGSPSKTEKYFLFHLKTKDIIDDG